MKKISRIIALLVCLCIFAAMAMGSGSSGSSSASKVGEVGESGSSSSNTESAAPAKTPEPKTEYRVGETFDNGGLAVTFVSSGTWISDNQFITPAEGKKFIRLYFHIDNSSGSDKSITTYSFNCYADGYECDSKYNDDDLSASLSSGRTADGAVYFEVPEDAGEIEIEYEYDIFNDKIVKFIYEGEKDSGLSFEKNTQISANAFRVGDIIETKKLRISYLKAGEYVSDNMFSQPEEGYRFVYIELEIENISDSDASISYFSFDGYADGCACSGYYGMDDALSATISAGRKAKGTIAYEVPIAAQVIEFEYEDNFWTDSRIVFLYED